MGEKPKPWEPVACLTEVLDADLEACLVELEELEEDAAPDAG